MAQAKGDGDEFYGTWVNFSMLSLCVCKLNWSQLNGRMIHNRLVAYVVLGLSVVICRTIHNSLTLVIKVRSYFALPDGEPKKYCQ